MPTTLYGIDDLVVALRDLDGVLQPAKVAAALREIRIDDRTIEAYCSWSARRYTRNLIARTDAFELIALCWDAGAFSATRTLKRSPVLLGRLCKQIQREVGNLMRFAPQVVLSDSMGSTVVAGTLGVLPPPSPSVSRPLGSSTPAARRPRGR